MSLAEFKTEILEHYLDDEFQVTVERDPGFRTTNNGLLHTALFYTIIHLNNHVHELDRSRLNRAVTPCWVEFKDRPVEGLLLRHPKHGDLFQGHDDYHVTTACSLLGLYHSEAIYNYGDENLWSFNNETPYNSSWLSWQYWRGLHWRFPGRPGYYALAAGKEISWLQTQLIKFDLWLGPSKESDGVMMQWLRIQIYKKSGKFENQIKSWESRFRNKYGLLNKAMYGYFKMGHPFSETKIDVSGVLL